VRQAECCVVGGGPAGVILGLMLAREGIRVTVLEAQTSFERQFRGNTLNPAVLKIMEDLSLIGDLLKLRHAEVRTFVVQTNGAHETFADFGRLRGPYPYVLMLPQARFLEFVTRKAERHPNFELVMGAKVHELIEEDGAVRGVRYRGPGGAGEVRADLTVGADGRFSKVRRLSGLRAREGRSPMDVLWFNLPREEGDPEGAGAIFRCGPGSLLVLMDHFDYWQVGFIVEKGSYKRVKEAGLPALQESVASLAPEFAGRVGRLSGWDEVSLLTVESDMLRRWSRPGLLLLGDAAHVVSPVGGVGINLAIQDAVAAANALAGPLRAGTLQDRHLRAVQRRREWPVRVVQAAQDAAQRWVVAGVLKAEGPYELPLAVRLGLKVPVLRDVPTRLIALGARQVRPKTR
jgi:2-polyprenyl-6-methoxyphenol hydroxylase-like FAD-dependent oxidoreductase